MYFPHQKILQRSKNTATTNQMRAKQKRFDVDLSVIEDYDYWG